MRVKLIYPPVWRIGFCSCRIAAGTQAEENPFSVPPARRPRSEHDIGRRDRGSGKIDDGDTDGGGRTADFQAISRGRGQG